MAQRSGGPVANSSLCADSWVCSPMPSPPSTAASSRRRTPATRTSPRPQSSGGWSRSRPVLSGGLGTLIKEFQQRGKEPAAQTWVSTGPNWAIAPNELADALGNDTLDELSKQTGMRREAVIAELSKNLPQLIDQLTPNGRVPTIEEASRMVA